MSTTDLKFTKIKTPITVYLNRNDSKSDYWKMYYCNDCRNPIMQYMGEVVMAVPGAEAVSLPIMIACSNKNCTRRYCFTGWVSREE